MIVAICVFSLFHPVELRVQPARHGVLLITQNGQSRTLEGSASVLLRGAATVTGRGGAETEFILSVPGKIQREFRGQLQVRTNAGHLVAIVNMDRETAVASIVAAESPPGAPLEARKAQAVVARSFLVASNKRHEGYDFCDTTHCQFLREPPAAGTINARAAEETRGLVIAYQGRAVATLYSANCGGRTRTLQEAGWSPEAYPYFAVECPVRGAVSGHRIGMCQQGASTLAKQGKTFRNILSWYFPATTLISADTDGRGWW